MKNNIKICILLCCVFCATSIVRADEKMKPEEVIAKHLESIGSKEKRDATKDKVVSAEVLYTVTAPRNVAANGKAVFASAGNKSLFGMSLNLPNYASEQIVYNGKSVKVTDAIPGTRSVLGEFMRSYDEIVSGGLFNGILGSDWALLNLSDKTAKLSYKGIKKINGVEAHGIEFIPKKRADVEITMYFDATNFHHIRTEYTKLISAQQGPSIDASAGQSAHRYRLAEDFSDFKNTSGLTIPTKYTLQFTHYGSALITDAKWEFKVNNVSYNQNLEDKTFEIDAKQ